MMKTKSTRRVAGFFFALIATLSMYAAALAQTVPLNSIPIGKGPGVTGFGSAAPGASGTALLSTGPASPPAFGALPAGPSFASVAQYYAGVSSTTIIPPSIIYPAETVTTYGTTTTFDFATFINTGVTLTGNITTQSVANVAAGKAGTIVFTQSGAGSFTTAWNSIFKFAGGAPPALTAGSASAIDVLFYSCRTATNCPATLVKDVR